MEETAHLVERGEAADGGAHGEEDAGLELQAGHWVGHSGAAVGQGSTAALYPQPAQIFSTHLPLASANAAGHAPTGSFCMVRGEVPASNRSWPRSRSKVTTVPRLCARMLKAEACRFGWAARMDSCSAFLRPAGVSSGDSTGHRPEKHRRRAHLLCHSGQDAVPEARHHVEHDVDGAVVDKVAHARRRLQGDAADALEHRCVVDLVVPLDCARGARGSGRGVSVAANHEM